MIVLGIDSSATAASAAVISDGKLVSENFSDTGLTHSQTLLPMIEKSLQMANISVEDIDLIAVANGPGSFTGVRIGIATVKGIAFTNNIECVEVSTLESMAYNIPVFDGIICSVMDARCNQVYTALFNCGNRLCEDKAVLIDELGNELKQYDKKIVFIGDGSVLCYEKLHEIIQNCEISNENIRYVHGSSVGFLAETKIANGEELIESANLVPFYLRLPQAERELNNKKSLKKEI